PCAPSRPVRRRARGGGGPGGAAPGSREGGGPQAGVRGGEPDDEAGLMAACRASRNPYLAELVTVAMETGLRRGELLGLTWDRIDLSRGVIRLEVTKSGKRREVPMRQVVYDIFVGRPGRQGRVW